MSKSDTNSKGWIKPQVPKGSQHRRHIIDPSRISPQTPPAIPTKADKTKRKRLKQVKITTMMSRNSNLLGIGNNYIDISSLPYFRGGSRTIDIHKEDEDDKEGKVGSFSDNSTSFEDWDEHESVPNVDVDLSKNKELVMFEKSSHSEIDPDSTSPIQTEVISSISSTTKERSDMASSEEEEEDDVDFLPGTPVPVARKQFVARPETYAHPQLQSTPPSSPLRINNGQRPISQSPNQTPTFSSPKRPTFSSPLRPTTPVARPRRDDLYLRRPLTFPVSPLKSHNVRSPVKVPVPRANNNENANLNSTMDIIRDFDRVPGGTLMDESMMFKPVRKKDERAKLDGWDCDLCRQYYKGLEADMHPSELQRLKNNCSRHRSNKPMNQNFTPPDAWRTTLPDTEEILNRGLIKIGVASPPVRRKRHDLLD